MDTSIKPFTVSIPQSAIDDLKSRLANARWPNKEPVADWSQGVPLAQLQSLVGYWRDQHDWRRCEKALNALPQFTTDIDGLNIHFIHVKSSVSDALPIVLTHGWPGSVLEFLKVIGPLTDPAAHGAPGAQAFHVVAPSLPGYGFSQAPATTGWGVEKIAKAWIELMARLGYSRFVAQGGDWGAAVTTAIGIARPAGCLGVHLNMPLVFPNAEDLKSLTEGEAKSVASMQYYQDKDSGYAKVQSTRPQTIGYALADSPIGQAAWIYEKLWAWTDNTGTPESVLTRDEILDLISLYWLTNSAASSGRLYWESMGSLNSQTIEMPVGASVFPKEIFRPSRRWAERTYPNLFYWNELNKGGHFAALEQPVTFVAELRSCFALIAK